MKTAFGCTLFPCFPNSSISSIISDMTFVPLPSFLLHFWRPILAHWFWHPYVVMAVISCWSLFHLLFYLVSSIFLCCFWSIRSFILHGIAVLYDPCSLSPIAPICFLYILRSLFIKVGFIATVRYLFLQSSLAWTHRFVVEIAWWQSLILTHDCPRVIWIKYMSMSHVSLRTRRFWKVQCSTGWRSRVSVIYSSSLRNTVCSESTPELH